MIFNANAGAEAALDTASPEPLKVLKDRIELVSSFSSRIEVTAFPLLVAVSVILSTADYLKLSPILWKRCLDVTETNVLSPVSSRANSVYAYLRKSF